MEVLGSAAAGIVHDINNELTLVLNHLSMSNLAMGNVEAARAAAFRCGALTASLLSYCRGDSLDVRQTDPVQLLRDFARNLRLPTGVRLDLDVPANLPAIKVDPDALRRVLGNLVLNACQAMENAGILTLRASDFRIVVEDSGPGIEPANLTRIFEPFFSTKGASGTGLGLAIVRELMQQQGGDVAVRSEWGGGAAFELRFPSST